jgi:hypothetical protein
MMVTAIFAVPLGLPRRRFAGAGASLDCVIALLLRLFLKKLQYLFIKEIRQSVAVISMTNNEVQRRIWTRQQETAKRK